MGLTAKLTHCRTRAHTNTKIGQRGIDASIEIGVAGAATALVTASALCFFLYFCFYGEAKYLFMHYAVRGVDHTRIACVRTDNVCRHYPATAT